MKLFETDAFQAPIYQAALNYIVSVTKQSEVTVTSAAVVIDFAMS